MSTVKKILNFVGANDCLFPDVTSNRNIVTTRQLNLNKLLAKTAELVTFFLTLVQIIETHFSTWLITHMPQATCVTFKMTNVTTGHDVSTLVVTTSKWRQPEVFWLADTYNIIMDGTFKLNLIYKTTLFLKYLLNFCPQC